MKQFLVAAGCASVIALPAFADIDAGDEVEQVVVTGSYSAAEFDPLTSRVTVIDREQLRASGKSSVLDVLRTVEGLSVRQAGGPGGVSEVNIRGSEANFTLVLVDGVRVNDSNNTRGGGFNFNSIDLELVERIEVVRGAQTAIYGGDALAGVIQIFTKPQTGEGWQQKAVVSLAGEGYYRANYGVYYAGDQVQADLSASALDSGRDVPLSSYDNSQLAGGVLWQIAPEHSLSTRIRLLNDHRAYLPEQSGGDQFATSYAQEQTDSQELANVVEWKIKPLEGWRSRLQYQRFEREATQDSPGIVPFDAVPPNFADSDYTSSNLLWVNTLGTGESFWVNLGADYVKEDGESTGNIGGFLDTSFELERDKTAVFAELNYQNEQELTAKLSARYDEPENLDGEESFSAQVAIPLADIFSISAAWGEGFKLPSFFALGHPLVGNPDLDPERSTTWDLRFAVEPTETLYASIAYFDNAFEDLIDFDPEFFTNVNRSQVDITGVEFVLNWQALENLGVNFTASFADIDTHDEDVKLSGRPEEQYSLNIYWQPASDHNLVLGTRHTGEQYDTSLYTGATVRYELDAYTLVDFGYTYTVTEHLQLSLNIDNLFDEEYSELYGFSAQDQRARIAARFRF